MRGERKREGEKESEKEGEWGKKGVRRERGRTGRLSPPSNVHGNT